MAERYNSKKRSNLEDSLNEKPRANYTPSKRRKLVRENKRYEQTFPLPDILSKIKIEGIRIADGWTPENMYSSNPD